MSEVVGGPELNEPLVHGHAVLVAPFEGEIVAVGAKDVDVGWNEFQNRREEFQFEIELGLLCEARQRGGWSRRRHFLGDALVGVRHGFPQTLGARRRSIGASWAALPFPVWSISRWQLRCKEGF